MTCSSRVTRQPEHSLRLPLASKRFTSFCSAKTSSAPIMPLLGRCVRAKEWPPSCATLERSIVVRALSHSMAASEREASSSIMLPV